MDLDTSAFWERYVPDRPGADPALALSSPSFQRYEVAGQTVTSMLTLYELALLFALAKDYYEGAGEIVDAGPLLGVTTNVLAQGLAANVRVQDKQRRIFSFDLFLDRDMGDYVAGNGEVTGSVFDRFLAINRNYIDSISISPGNLLDMRWTGKQIEILFIDIAKTWELNHFVLQRFFQALIPGRSVVIQQDYVYFDQYWIHITMEYLSDYFHPCQFVFGASALYQLVKPIPEGILNVNLSEISFEEKLALYARAIDKAEPSIRQVMKCGLARFYADNGMLDEAEAALDSVVIGIAHKEPHQDFSAVARSNVKVMREILATIRLKPQVPASVEPAIEEEPDKTLEQLHRLKVMTYRIQQQTAAIGVPPPGPNTLRSHISGGVIRLAARALWWYTGPLRQWLALSDERSVAQDALLEEHIFSQRAEKDHEKRPKKGK